MTMGIIRDFQAGKTGKKTTGYKGCENEKTTLIIMLEYETLLIKFTLNNECSCTLQSIKSIDWCATVF